MNREEWLASAEGVMESLRDPKKAEEYQWYLDKLEEDKEDARKTLARIPRAYNNFIPLSQGSRKIREMLAGLRECND
jgi:hypothetical protein